MAEQITLQKIDTDVLIIGGGTAGCYAAVTLGNQPNLRVLIVEKANIQRSGCLAAGVNALNAYISKGYVPEDYVEYARKDAEGIVRDDLLYTMSCRLNHVTEDMEKRGLVILKDADGNYVTRGWRNLKINGENIKPILAEAASSQSNVTVMNHTAVTDLITSESPDGQIRVSGAYGFSVNDPVAYEFRAKAVLIATGGAAGLYRPNNPGFSRHKMWYPPFNTGAGYAMGILAGAEMTTFENRFVALRCKDTIAPTGTIAQGAGARQKNAKGEIYETKYGLTTPERIWGTVEENRAGRGPCYLDTTHITEEQQEDLYKAYLNMAPSQTLKWLESGTGPKEAAVEVEGTEPYIVGGHTASGFWVDTGRRTTLEGLFAAGDVSGGAPQKYVTGALAEGEIAAESIAQFLTDGSGWADTSVSGQINPGYQSNREQKSAGNRNASLQSTTKIAEYQKHLNQQSGVMSISQLEEAMQKVMDEYAGGIGTDYRYNEERLALASQKMERLYGLCKTLAAEDMDDLMRIYEIRSRLVVSRTLIAHLRARHETRWHIFGENATYPSRSEAEASYVNSRLRPDGSIEMIRRPLVHAHSYAFDDSAHRVNVAEGRQS